MRKKIIAVAAVPQSKDSSRLYVLLESGKLYACNDDGGDEFAWEEIPNPEDDEGDE